MIVCDRCGAAQKSRDIFAIEVGKPVCPSCWNAEHAAKKRDELRAFLRENLRVRTDKNYNDMGGHDSIHDVELEIRGEGGEWETIA